MPQLIILRHGEKPDGPKSSLELSPIGKQRADFLAKTYLGQGAAQPLFESNMPLIFFAVTPHTIETACPSAESWCVPVTAFCTSATGDNKDAALDRRTKEAAKKIGQALEKGMNVVAIWEHHRIADDRTGSEATLRRLLKLDDAPVTWPDDDYDTIWLFAREGVDAPWQFKSQPQGFPPPLEASPSSPQSLT
jgi:broad specificity phosphatase PhoE